MPLEGAGELARLLEALGDDLDLLLAVEHLIDLLIAIRVKSGDASKISSSA